MRDLFWLSQEQLARMEPFFPLSHGVPRVDDRRVISGIIFVIKNGLCWSEMGVFDKIFSSLSAKDDPPGYADD